MKKDSGPSFFVKKNLGPGLFIDVGDGRGVIIHDKDCFQFVESSVQRPTSPELLDYPELLRAARAIHRRRDKDIEFLQAFERFSHTFWVAPIKNERPVGGLSINIENPPMLAEFLLTMLLNPSHAAGATGDLRECFDSECRSLGQRRAVWLYWRRTFESLWPLLRRATAKALKWAAVIAAIRRLF
jgi:hypothetical protein